MSSGTDPLDDIFASARAQPPEPPAALYGRVLADALEVQPPQHAQRPARRPARRAIAHRLQDWAAAVGGWPSLGGMLAATVAGVWIGTASPDSLGVSVSDMLWPSDTAALEAWIAPTGGLDAPFDLAMLW